MLVAKDKGGDLLILDDNVIYDNGGSSGPAKLPTFRRIQRPFTRIWCAFEEYKAIDMDIAIDIGAVGKETVEMLTDGIVKDDGSVYAEENKANREKSFPLSVMVAALDVTLEKAEASMDIDRTHILNCISKQELDADPLSTDPAFDSLNCRLRSKFAVLGFRGHVEESCNLDRISDCMSADKCLSVIRISFNDCAKMNDHAMTALARGLSENVKALSLSFSSCRQLTDIGVKELAAAIMQTQVQELKLDFGSCSLLSDIAAKDLASAIQKQTELKDLSLSFWGCYHLSDIGVKGLASAIQKQAELKELSPNFVQCSRLSDIGAKDLAAAIHQLQIKELSLEFARCNLLSNIAGKHLAAAIQKQTELKDLSLSFWGCYHLSDIEVKDLAAAIQQPKFKDLLLYLGGNIILSDIGVKNLAAAIQQVQIKELKLNFLACSELSDIALKDLASAIQKQTELKELSLDLAIASN